MKNTNKKSTAAKKTNAVESESVNVPVKSQDKPEIKKSTVVNGADKPKVLAPETVKEVPTILPYEFQPQNWNMISDIVVYLFPRVKYEDEVLNVVDKGYTSEDGAKIGASEISKQLVKSNIGFGRVEQAGKNTGLTKGEIISFQMQHARIVDFNTDYAIIQNFSAYARIGEGPKAPTALQPTAKKSTSSKNIFGRIFKGLGKWMGLRNVHQSK
jgi:hypothetical protein